MSEIPFNCIYCGKFIKWSNFEDKKARQHFVLDSEVSTEELWAFHVECEQKDKKAADRRKGVRGGSN